MKKYILVLFFLTFTLCGYSATFTAYINWPSWAGENRFYLYDPSGALIGSACWPSKCYNGANGSYSATVTLGTSSNLCGSLSLVTQDSYGDGWNSSGYVIIYKDGLALGTYYTSGYGQTFSIALPVNIGEETSGNEATPTCSNQTFGIGSGAYEDFALDGSTYYDFSWSNGSNANGFAACPQNGSGTKFDSNQTCWHANGTTTLRFSSIRSGSSWVGGASGSSTLTYRKTAPTRGDVNKTVVNFCESGGNFSAAGAIEAIGESCGIVEWNWGYHNGTWTGGVWSTGNLSPTCCFPKITNSASTGAAMIRYRVNNGGCYSAWSSTVTINNLYNEAPTSLTASTTSYCSNAVPGTINLTANFPTNINIKGTVKFYSGSCGGTLVATVTPGNDVSSVSATITAPSSTTNYFVRYEPGTGTSCSNTSCASTTVTVNPAPAATSVTGGGTFCGSTTINASGGSGGTIYFQGTTSNGTSTATASTSANITSSGTYYFRSRSAAGCWGAEGSVSVTINPLPAATSVTGGGTFCGSTTINASGGAGGTIYFQGTTSGGTSTATASTSANITSSGTYYFRSRSAAGCWGAEGSVSVTINPNPTANAGGALTAICQGATSSAMGGSVGGGATGGTWSGGAGTWTNAGNPSTATYTAGASESGSITLTLTTSGGSCGTTSVTKTIMVNPNPTANAGGALTAICQGATSSAMGGSVGGGATGGTWSGGAGTWTNAGNPSTATYTAGASESGSITLTLTTSGGSCGTTSVTKTIMVNPNPTANAGGALTAICQGATSSAMGGSVGGGATGGTWSGGAGTWTNAGNPSTATYTAGASESGSITLTLTTSGGSCGTTSVTKTIMVNPNPTANAGGALTAICQGATSSAMGGSVGGGATGGTWSGGAGTWTNASNPSTATYTAGASESGSITLTLTTSGGSCGTTSVTKTIMVDVTPSVSNAGTDQFSCLSPSTEMAANNPSVGTGTWTWSPSAPSYQSGTTANDYNAEVLFSASGSYIGTWTITNGTCTASTDDVVIEVNNPDVITTTAGASGTCESDGVNNWVHFYDASGNIIASVDDNGEMMGDVTVAVPTVGNASPSGVCSGGINAYMGRYFSWSSTNTGWYGNNVTVRLYFTAAELSSLITEAGCGDPNGCADDDDVCGIADVVGTKYATGGGPGGAGGVFLPQVGNGYDANFAANYVDFSVDGFSDIYLHGSEHNVPLPVELISWEAKTMDNEYIELTWSTATEINNDYFEILRSTDGVNFEKLAKIDGHGNSSEIYSYLFKDIEVVSGITYYYQLKQVDFDGQFELFEIKSASLTKNDRGFEISDLVPNPTNENTIVRTTIYTTSNETIHVYVFNQIGMLVNSLKYELTNGANDINIPIDNMASGTYFVHFESVNGIETKKLIVNK